MAPYTVALVVDPTFGEQLGRLASRLHTWAVGSPVNRSVAENFWASEPQPYEHNIERGITTFNATPGCTPEELCAEMVSTVDQHHDEQSHDPGYSILEVYGVAFNERLRPRFTELGFTVFEDTNYGFRAHKAEP